MEPRLGGFQIAACQKGVRPSSFEVATERLGALCHG